VGGRAGQAQLHAGQAQVRYSALLFNLVIVAS
jgi:hypothetical protein